MYINTQIAPFCLYELGLYDTLRKVLGVIENIQSFGLK